MSAQFLPACPNGCHLTYESGGKICSRVHGIEVPWVYDGVLLWKCPDCDHMWPTFAEGRRYRTALKLIAEWQAGDAS